MPTTTPYVTYSEFINSAYGRNCTPGEGVFATAAEVTDFLRYVSSLVDMVCGRSFNLQTYTDIADRQYGTYLYLNYFPVTAINSITYQYFSVSGVVDTTTYMSFPSVGKIKFIRGLDPNYAYFVNYTAGYSTIPDAIKMATMMWANVLAQSIDNESVAEIDGGAVTQFRFSKFWEQYADPKQRPLESDVPAAVYMILKRFRYLR